VGTFAPKHGYIKTERRFIVGVSLKTLEKVGTFAPKHGYIKTVYYLLVHDLRMLPTRIDKGRELFFILFS